MRTASVLQRLILSVLLLLLVTACSDDSNPQAQAGDSSAPPPEVGVVTIEPAPLAITEVLPGRLESTQVAEVRARASGIVLERTFREGSMVEAGQVLFRIDPAPMQAALNSARAALAKAEANLTQASLTAERYAPLVSSNAVSRQEYDNAVAVQAAAQADVAAAEAAVETAELNLEYTEVTSPISGRIGRALVTVGALVGEGEATPMATVQQFDPIYANLTQSSDDLLRLRRALAEGQLETASTNEAEVTLITADGQEYPYTGTLLFTDMTVNPSTSAVSLRATFPNPEGLLLPGMYVRAQLQQAVDRDAITIPQQSLQRSSMGASVLVVGDDGTVESRPVRVARSYENKWVISEGLSAGDVVIVDGIQKARPGARVTTTEWRQPATTMAEQVNEEGGVVAELGSRTATAGTN